MEKTSLVSLEINVISAQDLRLHHRSIKKNAFVVVRTGSQNSCSTSVDTRGGSCPSWNEKLSLPLPNSAKFITVEVQCKTHSRIRMVGTANIPVSDFIGDYTPSFYQHFLSYRLREPDGERNGIVNLSIRAVVPQQYNLRPSPMPPLFGAGLLEAAEKRSGGIAIGIPVAYGRV